ncbi:hypothetical protein EMCRGX_G010447 [Ephydatia muelleri]
MLRSPILHGVQNRHIFSSQPWSIDLWSCSTNAECMKMLTVVENGRAFDYIKSIEFHQDDKLGDQGAIVIVQLLTNSQTLANLELRECGLDDGAIYSLAKGLEHSKLKKLDLGGNHFTTRGDIELDRVLKLPHLSKWIPNALTCISQR